MAPDQGFQPPPVQDLRGLLQVAAAAQRPPLQYALHLQLRELHQPSQSSATSAGSFLDHVVVFAGATLSQTLTLAGLRMQLQLLQGPVLAFSAIARRSLHMVRQEEVHRIGSTTTAAL